MPSGLVPRYPQGRQIGLTLNLMDEKWLETTFLLSSHLLALNSGRYDGFLFYVII